MKMQYDQLTNLEQRNGTDMRNIGTLITTWEAELERFKKLDSDYACGKHQRRQILFKALPSEVRNSVEEEDAAGRLRTYEDLKDYIITLGSSSVYAKVEKLKPLLGNVDENKPEQEAPAAAAAPTALPSQPEAPPSPDTEDPWSHAATAVYSLIQKGFSAKLLKGSKGGKGSPNWTPNWNPKGGAKGSQKGAPNSPKGGEGDGKNASNCRVGRSGRPVECLHCGQIWHPQRLCPKHNPGGVNAVEDAWAMVVEDTEPSEKTFMTCDHSKFVDNNEHANDFVFKKSTNTTSPDSTPPTVPTKPTQVTGPKHVSSSTRT